jgi:hypothetical protein
MSVYVDTMRASFGRMVMCHMIADTREELDAMADNIGVQRKWIQHEGDHLEHYDVSLTKKVEAIRQGAIEIGIKELGAKCRAKRLAEEAAYLNSQGRTP